jgi:hypothetical protein
MKKLIVPFMFAMILGVGMAALSFAAGDMVEPSTQTVKGDLLTRSRPRPRIRAMHRPLNKQNRRCRFGDTNGEVEAQRLGQSSGLAQSVPRGSLIAEEESV